MFHFVRQHFFWIAENLSVCNISFSSLMLNVSLIICAHTCVRVCDVCRLAWQAMRQLHPEAIAAIQSKALFSQAEEALLAKISSVSQQSYYKRHVSKEVVEGK